MSLGSIYFKLLVVSGVVSCALGIAFWKDLWDRGTSTVWVIVQSSLFLWFCVLTAKLLMTSPPRGGIAGAIATVFVLAGLACLHAPLVISVLTKLAQDAFEGMIDPKSNLVVKKTYDEAEMAEARHQYDKALELYRAERERDPNDSHVRVKTGDLLAGRKRFEDAVAEFSSVLDMETREEKDLVYGALRAAEILDRNLGRKQDATVVLKRALEKSSAKEAEEAIRSRLSAYGEAGAEGSRADS